MAKAIQHSEVNAIGIVTVLYQSDDVIDDFFDSLALQRDVAFRLYVIDNSPTSACLDRCRQRTAQLGVKGEFVFNGTNVGVAKGNNQGIVLALRDGCRWVLLANNDTKFDRGTVSALLQPLLHGDLIASPKILYPGAAKLIWYAGGRIDRLRITTPHFGLMCPDRGQYDATRYTDYAPTCFMLLDGEVFDRVGYMDEEYFVYFDDTDFVWRLRKQGLRIRFVSDSIVVHKVGASTGGNRSLFTTYYSNRNRIYFVRKHRIGISKFVSLTYILMTRLAYSIVLPLSATARMWAGVRDGFRLAVKG